MPKYSQKFKKEAINLYKQGLSTYEVSEKLGCSQYSVWEWVKDSHTSTRSLSEARRKYHINHHFFDNIDSSEKAYIVGFILGDGCLCKAPYKSGQLQIGVHQKDKDILKKINKAMSSTYPICDHKNMVRLQIYSQPLFDALVQLGITPRKTSTAKIPCISSKFNRDLFRGLIDADGSISYCNSKENWGINLTGTKNVVSGFSIFLGYKGKYIYPCSNDITWRFSRIVRQEVIYILQCLYKNAKIYLDRKYFLYRKVIKEQGQQLMLF